MEKKCSQCDLPVYAKQLCRRHYKKMNSLKNGSYKKRWEKIKNDPVLLEKKRLFNKIYNDKKRMGVDTKRKTDDNAQINTNWKEYYKEWYQRTRHGEIRGLRRSSKYYEYKDMIIDHYTNGKNCCGWCGITDKRVLDVDHINDDGKRQRAEVNNNLTWWIVKNKFPEGFQILCRNCNWIKELNKRQKERGEKLMV